MTGLVTQCVKQNIENLQPIQTYHQNMSHPTVYPNVLPSDWFSSFLTTGQGQLAVSSEPPHIHALIV